MAQQEEKLRCTKEPFVEDVGTRRIMWFSMLSSNEIRQFAETQVWSNRIYGPDLKLVPNGLLDTRMGCSRVLLVEKDHREFLKKMRNSKEPLLDESRGCTQSMSSGWSVSSPTENLQP